MKHSANLFKTSSAGIVTSGFIYKLFTVIYFALLLMIISGLKNNAYSQNTRLNYLESQNSTEVKTQRDINPDPFYPAALELQHKAAMESGNEAESIRLNSEMESYLNSKNLIFPVPDNEIRFEKYGRSNSGTDWLVSDNTVYSGPVKSLPSYHKQIDMKCGDDSVLYTAINEQENAGLYKGKVSFYRSSDNGNSWISFAAIYASNSAYITNISMLVESRSNMHKDSTRIILFYTKAGSNNNDVSTLSFISFRVNGTSIISGELATAGAGKEFSHISPVSDGAYYSNGTYFGVVCSESNSAYTTTQSFKIFRTANWGTSWSSSSFTTGYNDFYPSADFFPGSPSQIFIAVERRPVSGPKELVLLRTNWTLSSSFTEQQISDANIEKPCLTIQKNASPDTMMITAINNGQAVYYGSRTSGAVWYGYNLSNTLANNFKFTHCYSSPYGSPPFTAIYSTQDGDSINIRRGVVGALGEIFYKVNGNISDPNISPVSAFSFGHETNLSSFIYGGVNSQNVYFDQDGFKWLLIGASIQGLYNPAANEHNIDDTVSVIFRNSVSPYEIVDSVKTVLDSSLLIWDFYAKKVNRNYGYYLVLKHRNSIETWSKSPVFINSSSFYNYDFLTSADKAYGNNLIKTDNSPVVYSLYSGDVNQDGTIDLTDGSLIDNDAFNFASGYLPADLNGDGVVDLADAVFADNNGFNFVSKITP